MANETKYTPEVEKLLAASRGLYDAAQKAKLTPGLAIALRDGIAFDRLQVEEIAALARFVRELEKASAAAPAAAANAPAETNGEKAEPAAGKPDDKKAKGSKGGKPAESAS